MPCLEAHHSVGAGLCSAPTRSRKAVKFIKISAAPSIDGNRSTATSCKFGTPVSGGAYQDARKVALVWNDAQNIGSCLNSEAGRTKPRPSAPFLPPSFPARRKRRGRRRRVRNDHDGTSLRYSRSLFSSVLISSFPNRKLNLRFGFYSKFATTSQSASLTAPLGGEPFCGGMELRGIEPLSESNLTGLSPGAVCYLHSLGAAGTDTLRTLVAS